MKETKDMTIEEIVSVLPICECIKGSFITLSYASPDLLINSMGELKPKFACSISGLDEKLVYESFLNTLIRSGYDKVNKIFVR